MARVSTWTLLSATPCQCARAHVFRARANVGRSQGAYGLDWCGDLAWGARIETATTTMTVKLKVLATTQNWPSRDHHFKWMYLVDLIKNHAFQLDWLLKSSRDQTNVVHQQSCKYIYPSLWTDLLLQASQSSKHVQLSFEQMANCVLFPDRLGCDVVECQPCVNIAHDLLLQTRIVYYIVAAGMYQITFSTSILSFDSSPSSADIGDTLNVALCWQRKNVSFLEILVDPRSSASWKSYEASKRISV